ncbi:Dihydrofolate synthase [Marinobacterium lacunae]|uniref:Dihydrofolate synthase/folylpolyglutamate synthase n=1 Tax=Marinobacterium lacunae TaxID=1232683 RepID=A0A081FZ76_9GAMM|nr:bifunctional tetrahydrofolate synthase/dihydrofolate synthase [Marinobacterium lacunae]KEA63831.1 Dihydrofolate synthase [Marinobacterium lacunae]
MQTHLPSTLDAWLARIEACHPAEIELGLERIKCVADRLGIDLSTSRKVLIGGTNGKGSTVTMLDFVLRVGGYTTGVYTSPHFLRYNERVCINGEEVQDSVLCEQFEKIEQARGEIELTYFEYGTLAALLCFADAKPDVLLLEIGLGGRLDAVNIVDCDIAVITSVALDHTDWLGNDREQIGREKAGIARSGKPVVCGDAEPPLSVIELCEDIGAPLWVRGRDYQLNDEGGSWGWTGRNMDQTPVSYASLSKPTLPLVNAATVVQVIELLELGIDRSQICKGLETARMTGRMQRLALPEGGCILDVAHNPEAASYMANWLSQNSVAGRTLMVVGMLADKDIEAVIEQLSRAVDRWYPASLGGARGASAKRLANSIRTLKGEVADEYGAVSAALKAARAEMGPNDRLVVAGSFVTVSEVLAELDQSGR